MTRLNPLGVIFWALVCVLVGYLTAPVWGIVLGVLVAFVTAIALANAR